MANNNLCSYWSICGIYPIMRHIGVRGWIHLMICSLILVAVSVLVFLHPVGNSDIFWQIKGGEWIWQNGQVPGHDIFSYTASGAGWVDFEWLSEILFFSVEKLSGFAGLSFLSLGFGLLLTTMLFFGLRNVSRSTGLALVFTFLILFLSASRFQLLRPELFGFFFFTAFLSILAVEKRPSIRSLLPLLLLQILWTNMHASAIVGPFVVLIFAVRDRRLFFLFLVLLAAMIVNPFTYEVYLYPFQHMMAGFTLSTTSDWTGAGLFSGRIGFGAWAAIILSLVSLFLIIMKRRVSFPLLVISALFVAAGIWIARFLPFAIISLCFLLADIFSPNSSCHREHDEVERGDPVELIGCNGIASPAVRRGRNDKRWKFYPVASAMAVFTLACFILRGPPTGIRIGDGRADFLLGRPVGIGMDRESFPDRAATFIRAMGIGGNMFNDMAYGGFLIYKLWPGREVFIDTRTPVYGDDFLREYSEALFDEEKFNELVGKYDISYIFYDPGQIKAPGGPLKFLLGSTRWFPLFNSDKAIIFVKTED